EAFGDRLVGAEVRNLEAALAVDVFVRGDFDAIAVPARSGLDAEQVEGRLTVGCDRHTPAPARFERSLRSERVRGDADLLRRALGVRPDLGDEFLATGRRPCGVADEFRYRGDVADHGIAGLGDERKIARGQRDAFRELEMQGSSGSCFRDRFDVTCYNLAT